jgi:SPX domain protein involved in polyphosphate accumulation
MVHFGQYILANQVPGWEEYYIGYKTLKKRIKQYASRAASASDDERDEIIRTFSRLLDSQIEKIVLFMIEKQGLLAGRLQKLRERRHNIQEGGSYTDNDAELAVSEPPEEFDTVQRLMSDYRYTYQAWNER